MTTPLLGHQQIIVSVEPDRVELTGITSGPAGSHAFEVAGMTVEVDAADPGVLNRVTIDDFAGMTTERFEVLVQLIGRDRADEVLEMTATGVRRSRLDGPSTTAPFSRRSSIDETLATLAVTLATSARPGLLLEESAVLALQALTLAAQAGLSSSMPHLMEEAVEAARTLVDRGPTFPTAFDPEGLAPAAATMRAAAALMPSDVAAQLIALSDSLGSTAAARRELVTTTVAIVPVAFTPDSLPLSVGATEPMLRHVSNDEFEVRLPGWAERIDDWWLRVCVAGDSVPYTVVPLLPEGQDAVALFLVDTAATVSLEMDIVADAFQPKSSPHLAAFKAALAAGRRAARLERLGDLGQARTQWLQSEALHREAGDEHRAGHARSIAHDELAGSHAARRMRVPPIITDLTGPIA